MTGRNEIQATLYLITLLGFGGALSSAASSDSHRARLCQAALAAVALLAFAALGVVAR